MSKDDFETMPSGTAERLKQLEDYARRASETLHLVATGGRYEVQTITVAGLELADPLFCAARVDTRIRNARHSHRRFS